MLYITSTHNGILKGSRGLESENPMFTALLVFFFFEPFISLHEKWD